jgi:hypothetical protein
MGELMPLGKAFGILAICMFGPNLPTEKDRHADQLQVWKNAANLCQVRLEHEQLQGRLRVA